MAAPCPHLIYDFICGKKLPYSHILGRYIVYLSQSQSESFFKWANLVISFFSHYNLNLTLKSVDIVHGIRTLGRYMVCANRSTELLLSPKQSTQTFLWQCFYAIYFTSYCYFSNCLCGYAHPFEQHNSTLYLNEKDDVSSKGSIMQTGV